MTRMITVLRSTRATTMSRHLTTFVANSVEILMCMPVIAD